jgi:hypothetical protein
VCARTTNWTLEGGGVISLPTPSAATNRSGGEALSLLVVRNGKLGPWVVLLVGELFGCRFGLVRQKSWDDLRLEDAVVSDMEDQFSFIYRPRLRRGSKSSAPSLSIFL